MKKHMINGTPHSLRFYAVRTIAKTGFVRGDDGMFFVISMLAYPDVHSHDCNSRFLSLSAVLNAPRQIFRPEAAPICRGALESRKSA
jgi:hypothetical protein